MDDWNKAIEAAAKLAEQTEEWTQIVEKTDSRDIYTGEYESVKRITPKYRDGQAIAKEIRALARPAALNG